MQFPIVKQFKEDIQGINHENLIVDEPRKLNPHDGRIEIIVPRHAPFFIDSLIVTKRDGSPLDRYKDYRPHRIMGRLSELAGQPVGATIEIINEDLSEVLLTYRTLGEFSLIDNSVLQTIIDVANDDRIIHWNDLYNKPIVFPPKLHSHSLNDEIIALQDLVDFIERLSIGVKESLDDDTTQDRLNNYVEILKHYLKLNVDMVTDLVKAHESTYNSHGLTKTQVGLGNVDNTATAKDSDLYSDTADQNVKLTPGQLETLIKNNLPDMDGYLEKGMLPLSQYGSGHYIPPPVSGSFEAFGTESEVAIFEELDKDVILLKNRYDGKVRGLYYSIISDFKTKPRMTYTAHKYKHPFLEGRIGDPTRLAGGDGTALLVSGGGRVFLTLTNGTLDPDKHKYSELDFTDLAHLNTYNNVERMKVVSMGRWVYIFMVTSYAPTTDWVGSNGSASYKLVMKVPKASVGESTIIKPTHVRPTFTDFNGIKHDKAAFWRFGEVLKNDKGFITKFGYDFSKRPLRENFLLYRGAPVLTDGTNNRVAKIRFINMFYGVHDDDQSITRIFPEQVLEWDTETDVVKTLLNYPTTYDSGEWNNSYSDKLTSYDWQSTSTCLSTGVLSTRMTIDDFTQVIRVNYGPGKSRLAIGQPIPMIEVCNSDPGLYIKEKLDYPTRAVPYVSTPILDENGYYFTALDRSTGDVSHFYKLVNGGYSIRPEITVNGHSRLYSKPLSSKVYKLETTNGNFRAFHGFNVSTDFNNLKAKGLNSGVGSVCIGVNNKYTLSLGDNTDPDGVTIVGDTNRVLNAKQETMDWTVTKVIKYPGKVLRDFVKREVVNITDKTDIFFVIMDGSEDAAVNKHFKELPIVLIAYVYRPEIATVEVYHFTIKTTKTVSGNNRTITSISKISMLKMGEFGGAVTFSPSPRGVLPRGMVYDNAPSAYFDYTKQEIRMMVGGRYYLDVVGGSTFDRTILTVGMGDGVIKSGRWLTQGDLGKGGRGSTGYGFMPGLGLCYRDMNSSGVACVWRSDTTSDSILMASGYLESGWVVYFGSSLEVVLDGVSYILEPGSIDLRDISNNPTNKKFYIYVRLVGGKATYHITEDKLMEKPTLMWIGEIKTSSTQISTIETANSFTINGHKVSQRKQGNAIPATSGLINEEGQLPWIYLNELKDWL